MNTDTAFARAQKAYQKAQDILKEANENDIKNGYNHIHKALTSFVSDRLGMAEGGISDQEFIEAVQNANLDKQSIQELKLMLTKCSTINYAPDANTDAPILDIEKADQLLQSLKKQL